MKNLRLALIGGSLLLLAAGGMSVVACGNDDSNGFPTATDAGKKDSAPGDDDDDDDDASTPTKDAGTDSATTGDSATGDAGSDCGSLPFVPTYSKGNYCPFSAVGDGGNAYCGDPDSGTGPTCCETPADASAPSSCVAQGAACPVTGSVIWECGNDDQCSGGEVCCVVPYADEATTPVTVKQDTGVCAAPYLSGAGGSTCKASCAATDLSTCAANTTGGCTMPNVVCCDKEVHQGLHRDLR